jgi:hypothetical protein
MILKSVFAATKSKQKTILWLRILAEWYANHATKTYYPSENIMHQLYGMATR